MIVNDTQFHVSQLLEQINVIEKSLKLLDIKEADEVFTTNAISGIIPVEVISFETTKIYKTDFAQQLQERLINSSLGLQAYLPKQHAPFFWF